MRNGALGRELGSKWLILNLLGRLAELATAIGDWERAGCLGGVEAVQRERANLPLEPFDREGREQVLVRARQELGERGWTRAWEVGRAMSLEEAVAYALGETEL